MPNYYLSNADMLGIAMCLTNLDNAGKAVCAALNEDGTYNLVLIEVRKAAPDVRWAARETNLSATQHLVHGKSVSQSEAIASITRLVASRRSWIGAPVPVFLLRNIAAGVRELSLVDARLMPRKIRELEVKTSYPS